MQPINDAFIFAIKYNNIELMGKFAQAIALAVSKDLNGRDIKFRPYISDKDLSSFLSEAIYNFLVAIANYENDDVFKNSIIPFLTNALDSSENPELYPHLDKAIKDMLQQEHVTFKSDFLNAEYEKGNITFNLYTQMVYLLGSYEFRLIEGDGKKHKDKITSQLKKEGYVYKDEGYFKSN